jgi:hypothetical protein
MGDAKRGGVVGGDVLEEGSHRRQPRIACLDLVPARDLQVIEEGKDGVAIQVADGEFAWPTSGPIVRLRRGPRNCRSWRGKLPAWRLTTTRSTRRFSR